MRSIICCLLLLCFVAPCSGETVYQWPDAPEQVLREEIFGLRFRLAIDQGGSKGGRTFLQNAMAKGFQPHTRAYVAWVSLYAEAWDIPALVEPALAESMAEDAVQAGSPLAADVLGRARIYGQAGVRRDEKEGLALLQKAVDQGQPRAMARMGVFMMQGFGRDKPDVMGGALMVRRAAALGSLIGLVEAAQGFESGRIGGTPSLPVAMEYYHLLADYNEALGWKKLAEFEEKNIPGARYLRALTYVRYANDGGGFAPTVVRQHVATLEEIGQSDARTWLELGVAHLDGVYAKRDYAKALEYLRKAETTGLSEATFFLAYARMRGLGVPREPQTAQAEMQALADAGNARAAMKLGHLYYWGSSDVPGMKKDPVRAFTLTRIAAEAGYRRAALNLAFCYEHGIGTKTNSTLAAKMYALAAEGGFRRSAQEKMIRHLAFIKEPK